MDSSDAVWPVTLPGTMPAANAQVEQIPNATTIEPFSIEFTSIPLCKLFRWMAVTAAI
jgi:hypothetical protein